MLVRLFRAPVVLVVEKPEEKPEALVSGMLRRRYACEVVRVEAGENVPGLVQACQFDLILLAAGRVNDSLPLVLAALRQAGSYAPVVVLLEGQEEALPRLPSGCAVTVINRPLTGPGLDSLLRQLKIKARRHAAARPARRSPVPVAA
jgi:hypothetical protein